jgi:hypothetical protein
MNAGVETLFGEEGTPAALGEDAEVLSDKEDLRMSFGKETATGFIEWEFAKRSAGASVGFGPVDPAAFCCSDNRPAVGGRPGGE